MTPAGMASRPPVTRIGFLTPAVLLLPLVALVVDTIGADTWWLPAVARATWHGAGLRGVPFAAAPTGGWHDPFLAGGLVLVAAWAGLGARGLIVLNGLALLAAGVALAANGRRRGATDRGFALALVLVTAGALPALAVTRIGLYSVALFPLLLGLLAAETGRPSARIWWAVPMLAAWANLHGGVLLGYLALICYLLAHRLPRQPGTAVAVGGAGFAALLCTSAFPDGAGYYLGVLRSVAARTHQGMWAPLTSRSIFDLLLVAAAAGLLLAAARGGVYRWELLLAALLAFETVRAARTGVFLLFTLAPAAAAALPASRTWPQRRRVASAGVLLACVALLVRMPAGTPGRTVRLAAASAAGAPVLADDLPGEQLVEIGGRVWVANPLDAFREADQRLYLDWSAGQPAGDAALDRVGCLVLTRTGSAADRRASANPQLIRMAGDGAASLYRKGSCAGA